MDSKITMYRVAVINAEGRIIHQIELIPMTTAEATNNMRAISLNMPVTFYSSNGEIMIVGPDMSRKSVVVCQPMEIPADMLVIPNQEQIEQGLLR